MELINGNCLEVLKNFESNSIDAIVTDPPYGLSFMGKKWDYDVPSQEIWEEALRVLKPGGYLLAFAGTRTQHRMAVRIEDAGFEIRDMIAWVYGSGFPKSLNIGKQIDKTAGVKRKVIGMRNPNLDNSIRKLRVYEGIGGEGKQGLAEKKCGGLVEITEPNTDEAKEWEGWGSSLKPALEPITVARKPLEGTIAQNCLKWGVGGINIDGCRVGMMTKKEVERSGKSTTGIFAKGGVDWKNNNEPTGRFPSNLIHDGSDEVVGLFPQTKTGNIKPYKFNIKQGLNFSSGLTEHTNSHQGDSGSAARFFYCAKASKSERNRGCEDMEDKLFAMGGGASQAIKNGKDSYDKSQGIGLQVVHKMKNNHPTVKPISLMEYLVKLVSKEGHTVLDPFMGSGSTGIACKKLGREFIGIELDADYCKIAEARINAVKSIQNKLF